MNIYNSKKDKIISFFFVLIPLIFIILGLLIFPDFTQVKPYEFIPIPNFIGMILLAIGFFLKTQPRANQIKIAGWGFMAFFWSTQTNTLFYSEEGDVFNASLCIIGVFVLFYFAYREWLLIKNKEQINCLNWVAGAAALAGLIYFIIELTPLQMLLREVVAFQSAGLLNIFTGDVIQKGVNIYWRQANIILVFACTAVQSMVLFVGIIIPLSNIDSKRKLYSILITVLPVYILNLVRNALVVFLTGIYGHEFFPIAHNVLAKIGGVVVLIILLLILIKILPELFDEITCLTDLPKKGGPIELFIKRHILRKK